MSQVNAMSHNARSSSPSHSSLSSAVGGGSKVLLPGLEALCEGYECLRAWLQCSLDEFREEMWPALWVCFLQACITLQRSGKNKEAEVFFENYRGDHELTFHQEVLELAGNLASRQEVKRPPQMTLMMSKYARELLVSFLMENELVFLLSLLNQGVRFETSKESISRNKTSCLNPAGMNLRQNASVVSGVPAEELKNIEQLHVKWGVNTKMRSLQNGVIGLIAARSQYPEVPLEYHPDGRPKEDDELPDEEHKTELKKLEEDPNAPKRKAAKLTKLDRHNMMKMKESQLREGQEEEVVEQRSKWKGTNHMAPEGAEVDSGHQFLASFERNLVAPLQLRDMDGPEEMSKKTIAEKLDEQINVLLQGIGRSKQDIIKASEGCPIEGKRAWPSVALQTFFNTHDSLICTEVSYDAKTIAAGFADSVVRVWTSSGAAGSDPICEDLVGHSGPVFACSLDPAANSLLTSSEDGTIRLWMRSNGKAVEPPETKEGRKLPGSWRNIFTYRTGTKSPVWDVQFSPAGHYFLSGSHDGRARLWSVEGKAPVRIFSGHLSDVNCCAWHPNCVYVVTGSSDKTLRVWNIMKGRLVRLFCGHTGEVNSAAFCTSGRYLISGGQDQKVIVWDFASGDQVMVLGGPTASVWSVAIAPDMLYIACGAADGAVRIWDTDLIWGPNSLAAFKAANGLDRYSKKTPHLKLEEVVNHIPQHYLNAEPACRSFPTKYTPVHDVKFVTERLIVASGSFALPRLVN